MKSFLKMSLVMLITFFLLTISVFTAWSPLHTPQNARQSPMLAHAQNSIEPSSVITFTPVVTVYLPAIQKARMPLPPGEIKVGLVTDVSGIDDHSYNELSWQGLLDAEGDFGVDVAFLESQSAPDYATNIDEFIQQDFDLIVTVGFLMIDATESAAAANPDARFAIVDVFSLSAPNILQSDFAVDEAAFLAGYLAAGVSETEKVGTYGGLKILPVVQYMVGFEQGVNYYNQVHLTNVDVLGWSSEERGGLFIGNFNSTDDGYVAAGSLFDQGADILLPVAGQAGLGSADLAQDRGLMIIGTDFDWYDYALYQETYLTSILKRSDRFSYEATRSIIDGSFSGGVFNLDLSNNGVGLADYHDNADQVLPALQGELDQLRQALIDGTVTTCWTEYQNNQPCP